LQLSCLANDPRLVSFDRDGYGFGWFFLVFDLVGEYTERDSLGRSDRLFLGRSICQSTWKIGDLGNPPSSSISVSTL